MTFFNLFFLYKKKLDSTKNVTGLVNIVGHLVSFWKEGDPTCRTKCNYFTTDNKKYVKLKQYKIGIELLAQVVTPSQSALDSSTSKK